MVAHNNQVPHEHFHKHWQRRVRTWFNQPARHKRRHDHRVARAKALFPRPTQTLRPIVRCPSRRYNMKVRAGRGFSIAELKAAKLNPRFARTIGIAVDRRRHPRSKESMQVNVDRLREYMKNLVLLPLNPKKVHEGETAPEEFKKVAQVKKVMPISQEEHKLEFVEAITPEMRKYSAVKAIRAARREQRFLHKRKIAIEMRAKRKEEKAANKDKKPADKKGAAAPAAKGGKKK